MTTAIIESDDWSEKSSVSIVVSIPACHVGDLGSIPRRSDRKVISKCRGTLEHVTHASFFLSESPRPSCSVQRAPPSSARAIFWANLYLTPHPCPDSHVQVCKVSRAFKLSRSQRIALSLDDSDQSWRFMYCQEPQRRKAIIESEDEIRLC